MQMENEILIAIRKVIRAMDLHSKQLVKTSELTTAQLLLMRTIKANENVSIGYLADIIHLSQATVTTILDRLEQRGLLKRNPSMDDRRKVHVSLTEKGEKLLASAPPPLQENFVEKLKKLDEWEKTSLLSTLQRIANMMDAEKIDASPILDTASTFVDESANGASNAAAEKLV